MPLHARNHGTAGICGRRILFQVRVWRRNHRSFPVFSPVTLVRLFYEVFRSPLLLPVGGRSIGRPISRCFRLSSLPGSRRRSFSESQSRRCRFTPWQHEPESLWDLCSEEVRTRSLILRKHFCRGPQNAGSGDLFHLDIRGNPCNKRRGAGSVRAPVGFNRTHPMLMPKTGTCFFYLSAILTPRRPALGPEGKKPAALCCGFFSFLNTQRRREYHSLHTWTLAAAFMSSRKFATASDGSSRKKGLS